MILSGAPDTKLAKYTEPEKNVAKQYSEEMPLEKGLDLCVLFFLTYEVFKIQQFQ